MGVRLQRSPTTRSLGEKNSRHSVLSQAEDGPGTECELSKGLGDTACTHQRTDQVARTEAVCRRSVCGVSAQQSTFTGSEAVDSLARWRSASIKPAWAAASLRIATLAEAKRQPMRCPHCA